METAILLVRSERRRKERYSPFAVQFRRSRPSLYCRRVDLGVAPTCALVAGLEFHLTIPAKPHPRSCGNHTGYFPARGPIRRSALAILNRSFQGT